ncbi:hypothetical protein HZS_2349 [Henneguya salminicola]|nr:hypothetical protein HZS_2349 [Henneguya salminicola]
MLNEFDAMNPIIWLLYFISLYLSKSEKVFDSIINKIDFRVVTDIFGYSSFRNTGMNQKCCGNSLKEICDPCQYIMYLTQIIKGHVTREFEVGTFNRPSQQLKQRIRLKILGLGVKMVRLKKHVHFFQLLNMLNITYFFGG